MEKDNYFSKKKSAILLTLLIMLIGSASYFGLGIEKKNMSGTKMNIENSIFIDMKLKAVYTEEGQLKVFAYAKNNELSKLKAAEGKPIPETDSIVIGYEEANMMKEEGKFKDVGDKLDNLFGINTHIEGVLERTGTIVDDFHFVSESEFPVVNGEENRLFIALSNEGLPKFFYNYDLKEYLPLEFKLAEGDMQNYKKYFVAGKDYYPLVLGYKEAEMMRKEKLFVKTGDFIKGFFGKDVVIVGVIEKTDSALDMVHMTPITEQEIRDRSKYEKN